MENKETVCAVVVTYNRKELLIECLDALLKQIRPIDAMYIIDNFSNDGTEKLLLEKGYIAELPPSKLKEPWEKEFEIKNLIDGNNIKVHYIKMHENTGGAGGFYEGVKRGYEAGYDWMWLMDDDAEPLLNTLEKLMNVLNNKKISLLCPLIIMKDGRVQKYHHKFIKKIPFSDKTVIPHLNNIEQIINPNKLIKIDASAFVGPIINKQVIERIGYPNPQLFIWGDDIEYTYRATSAGVDIYLTLDSFIYHKDKGYAFEKNISQSDYWKIYHGTKNKIYISYSYIGKISATTVLIRTILSFLNRRVTFELYKTKIRGLFDGFVMARSKRK